jgi:Lipocalin-like domain
MWVNMMRPGATEVGVARIRPLATAAETAEAAAGDLAYAGRFTVDEVASVAEHSISTSLFPNWIGEAQRRLVHLSGDTLVLKGRPSAAAKRDVCAISTNAGLAA